MTLFHFMFASPFRVALGEVLKNLLSDASFPPRGPTFTANSRTTAEILRRMAVCLKPYKLLAGGTIACALFSTAFALAHPKLTQFVIDQRFRFPAARSLR
jgi:hypothetical protein